MALRDWLRSMLGAPSPTDPLPLDPSAIRDGVRALQMGGRVSIDDPSSTLSSARVIVSPTDHESDWRMLSLDAQTLSRATPGKLLEYLTDLSPTVSRALWDFLRLCNPGWKLVARQPGSDEIDARGQALIDQFLVRLSDYYGTPDVVWNRLFLAGYLRGAHLGELVLDERGREMIDLATPDPQTVRFERVQDPLRGPIWVMGQWQSGQWVRINVPTVRYVPIDPLPGKPYGRSPAHPAVFSALFLLGMLHDVRRVITQQGYPRIDLTILVDKLRAIMPNDARADTDKQQQWIAAAIAEIKSVYQALEPDDAYVHTDVIEVGRPVGTVDSSSLGGIDSIIGHIERSLVQALKTMPLMMGITDGVSEANANRQWEIQTAGIKSLQHLTESLIGRLMTIGLQASGVQAVAEMRFAELRAAEEHRDAQTEQLQISNAVEKVKNRWWTNNEAAQTVVGHDAVDPDYVPTGGDGGPSGSQANPEPGASRITPRLAARAMLAAMERETIHPEGEPLDLPETVEITDDDKQAMLDLWDRVMPEYATLLDAAVENDE